VTFNDGKGGKTFVTFNLGPHIVVNGVQIADFESGFEDELSLFGGRLSARLLSRALGGSNVMITLETGLCVFLGG